jgi:hypothetical protein
MDMRLSGGQPLTTDESQWLRKKRQVVSDWAVELAANPLLELPLNQMSTIQPEASRSLLARLQQRLHQKEQAKSLRQESKPQQQESDDGDQPTVTAPLEESPALTVLGVDDSPAAQESESKLMESRRLRDPRLRALVAIDLRSYERSVAAGDYRLAAVLLASVLESALIDHVLPRRNEFGLTGSPETWNPQELLIKAMGEKCAPKDRSMVYHLFSARSLLRPALQMMSPMIVTMASFGSLREFVQRALHHMGFSLNRGDSEAPPRSALARLLREA